MIDPYADADLSTRSALERNAALRPAKAAFLCGDKALSHLALWAEARRFANMLRARGVEPGQRVVLVLPDSLAMPKAVLGTMLLGAVPVPAHATLTPADLAFILGDCQAAALVTWDGSPACEALRLGAEPAVVVLCGPDGPWSLSGMSSELEAVPPGDGPGFMLYSSGTTGRPKGVPHAAQDLLRPAASWGRGVLGFSEGDLGFSASKFSFAYGLMSSVSLPLFFGSTSVLLEGKPGPLEVLQAIARHRPTVFFGVPTLYSLMARTWEPGAPDTDLSSLRLCYSAGEALPEGLCRRWMDITGVDILDGIGSTEAFNLFLSNVPGRVACGTSGELAPGFEARLEDDSGSPVADGTPGNLLVRGAGTCAGYWNRPEKTAEAMLPGGWLATGDVYVRSEGRYTHQGRSDDMLKVGAHWVSPLQIEEALRGHEAVGECAVAGMRVDGLVRPCAFVVAKPGRKADGALGGSIMRHARETLPVHMCPARVRFMDDLPKTPTGKVQRFRLREA